MRDPVTQSLRVRCTAAPAPAPAPVALPSTAHCPASGDHPPTSTRPPRTRTAIRAAAARRPTDYGARARAGGTCLVAVLHAASVIGCWRRAAGAASLRTAPDARCTLPTHLYQQTITLAAPAARPQHPMTLAACNTATRHVPPALALAHSILYIYICICMHYVCMYVHVSMSI